MRQPLTPFDALCIVAFLVMILFYTGVFHLSWSAPAFHAVPDDAPPPWLLLLILARCLRRR